MIIQIDVEVISGNYHTYVTRYVMIKDNRSVNKAIDTVLRNELAEPKKIGKHKFEEESGERIAQLEHVVDDPYADVLILDTGFVQAYPISET